MSPEERQREIARHQVEKNAISARFKARLSAIMESEGVGAKLIGIIMVCLLEIIILLALPEPLISKLTAILLAVGVGVLSIGAIVMVLLNSRDRLVKAADAMKADEDTEDELHRKNLAG